MGTWAVPCIHSFECGGFTQDIFHLSFCVPHQPPPLCPYYLSTIISLHSSHLNPSLCRFPRTHARTALSPGYAALVALITILGILVRAKMLQMTYWGRKKKGPAFKEQTYLWLTWSSGSQIPAGVWLKGEYRHGACHQKQQPCLSIQLLLYSPASGAWHEHTIPSVLPNLRFNNMWLFNIAQAASLGTIHGQGIKDV